VSPVSVPAPGTTELKEWDRIQRDTAQVLCARIDRARATLVVDPAMCAHGVAEQCLVITKCAKALTALLSVPKH